MAQVTLGGGCFWCIEAVFQEVAGVTAVISGYAGGEKKNPTYEQICRGKTGHAEVCRIVYDPDQVSFTQLMEIFFRVHDPTTPNRQGNDVGTQYRSIVLTEEEGQLEQAIQVKEELDATGAWKNPIVTEIGPLVVFYKAEEYHQNYFRRNPTQGYCRYVIAPKMDKFRKVFANLATT